MPVEGSSKYRTGGLPKKEKSEKFYSATRVYLPIKASANESFRLLPPLYLPQGLSAYLVKLIILINSIFTYHVPR